MGYSEVIMLERSPGRQLETGNFHERREPSWRAGRCLFSEGLILLSHHVCPPFSWLALQCKRWALSSFTLGSVARKRKRSVVADIRAPVSRKRKFGFWDGYFVISGSLRKSVYYSTEVFLLSLCPQVSVSCGSKIKWRHHLLTWGCLWITRF